MFFVMGCEPGQGGLVCRTVDAVSLWGPQGKTQNRTANAFFFSPLPHKSICFMPKTDMDDFFLLKKDYVKYNSF